MTAQLSPVQFFALAVEATEQAALGGFDVPELWVSIAELPRREQATLFHWLGSPDAREEVQEQGLPWPPVLVQLLWTLTGACAGLVPAELARTLADDLVVAASQSPLANGFAYFVEALLSPSSGQPEPGEARSFHDVICTEPFERLDVLTQTSHLCCASWLHADLGDLGKKSYDEVWNSELAQRVRLSVLDGSYRYCNKKTCPAIVAGSLPLKSEVRTRDAWWARVIDEGQVALDRLPRRLNLAYDRSCNLSCPSCRPERYAAHESERERLDRMTERNIVPLLRDAREVMVTGSGEALASRTFRKLLATIDQQTCPNGKVMLMTNGMLLSAEEWAKFPNLRGRVSCVRVSLDGATKATHELLRRGSVWEVVQRNLPFIGELLARKEIDAYELVFVVQRENFREMGAFVDLARTVGACTTSFERLTNWGTFDDAAYRAKAVFLPGHPEHAEFLASMTDPRLRLPGVNLGSLADFANEA